MPKVKLDISNLKKIINSLSDNKKIRIGILGNKDSRDKGSNATIGLKQEFGSFSEKIPARSFIRRPLQDNLGKELSPLFKNIMPSLEKLGIEPVMKKIGIKAEEIIQNAFNTGGFGKWAPLSERTIKKKGHDKKLIDTVQLRRSITSEVK